MLLPPEAVPSELLRPQRLATDGKQATIEAVRDLSWRSLPLLTLPENWQRDPQRTLIAGYRVAALAGAIVVLLVAAPSLAVSTIDGVLQQRRQIAGLLALGVPAHVLRRTALLQTVVPLLLNLALATATGVVTATLYVGLYGLRTALAVA